MSVSPTPELYLLPSGRPLPTEPMGYEQFLEWIDEDDHCEWGDGMVAPMAGIDALHHNVVRWLGALLPYWLEAHSLGSMFGEPFQMKTGPDLPGRSPDCYLWRTSTWTGLSGTVWTVPPTWPSK